MKYLIYFLLFITLICSSAFAERYALVKDGKIIKYKYADATDNIMKPKLLAHGYLIVNESIVPVYDPVTQLLVDTYVISKDAVTRVYSVQNKDLATAKAAKKADINIKALNQINANFGQVDQNAKIVQVLNTKDQNIVAADAAKTVEELRDCSVP